MNGKTYERELKLILAGDRKYITNYIKKLNFEEIEGYMSLIEHPFLVMRAAGSFGIDLIALRYDYSFPIEVKASINRILRFTESSNHSQKQAMEHIKMTTRSGLFPLYGYRLKRVEGDPWKIFTLPDIETHGNLLRIYSMIPKAEISKEGNYILRWDDGLKLSSFLRYINGIKKSH
ncbi:MAG: Holliday junction resolvase [Thermoplasmata archaeon]